MVKKSKFNDNGGGDIKIRESARKNTPLTLRGEFRKRSGDIPLLQT